MDVSVRSTAKELMDDPSMDMVTLQNTYADINRCNALLGGYGITLRGVWKLVKNDLSKSYTILDMGCGDGDILRKLANYLTKKKVKHQLIGVDLRSDVLDIAREKSAQYATITYQKIDILELKEDYPCDILINTLTMHHFPEEQMLQFLEKFVAVAKLGVVINDLQRSILSYRLFQFFSLFFIRGPVAKYDGLVSITRGFRKSELLEYAKKLPKAAHTIQWKWAFRYVWIMQLK